ncbi:histidine phosphatase family protein [Virgibacillus oceani]
MDNCVAISLLRHGMTEENERRAYIGWTDAPLSDKGKEMMYQKRKDYEQHDMIFSSPMVRCLQTAEILFPNQKLNIVPDMKEMNFGLFEGKTYEQLKSQKAYINWLSNPFSRRPPHGESYYDFEKRVEIGRKKVAGKIGETEATNAVIVAHGGVIRQLLSTWSASDKPFFEWKIPYGGGYQLIWTKEAFRRGEKCMSLQVVPTTEKLGGSSSVMN